MRTIILFRGPSGSDKTTAAKQYVERHGGAFFEADSFFERDGQYQFEPSKLAQAHNDCQRRVREAVQNGIENVVVSNTTMARWEANPYLALAKEFGYDVKIYRIKDPWDAQLFASRNKHNVPLAVIERQISKYQSLENEEEYT